MGWGSASTGSEVGAAAEAEAAGMTFAEKRWHTLVCFTTEVFNLI